MNEEKTLFSVKRHDEGVGVEFHVKEMDDFFALAAALVSTFDECPILYKFVQKLQNMLETDEEFRETVRKATISFPDFNKILKS